MSKLIYIARYIYFYIFDEKDIKKNKFIKIYGFLFFYLFRQSYIKEYGQLLKIFLSAYQIQFLIKALSINLEKIGFFIKKICCFNPYIIIRDFFQYLYIRQKKENTVYPASAFFPKGRRFGRFKKVYNAVSAQGRPKGRPEMEAPL